MGVTISERNEMSMYGEVAPVFWTPENHANDAYWLPPTQTELNVYWQTINGSRALLDLPEDVYGVCSTPPGGAASRFCRT